jgi:hypothetical protein
MYTVNEVVAMFEDDNSAISVDIFITPPSDDELSAEDSDNDDQPWSINHISGVQLSTEVEAKIVTASRRSTRIQANDDATNSSDNDDIPWLSLLRCHQLHANKRKLIRKQTNHKQRNMNPETFQRMQDVELQLLTSQGFSIRTGGVRSTCLNCFSMKTLFVSWWKIL